MDKIFEILHARLKTQGLYESDLHFSHAHSAFERSEWESANAQIRTALESLFDNVAKLTLDSNKTGGAARKQLQDNGLLRPREAKLVMEFMSVAGGAGSHAGVSNADESYGRMLAGIGIAYMGLALIPELIRVEDVLIGNLTAPEGASLPTDIEMFTSCPTCHLKQSLSVASITRDNKDTIYICKNGCQTIVVVSSPEESAWSGRGYRLGNYVLRNAQDLFLPIKEGVPPILIPASKAALMKSMVGSS
ncbi:hypothetical protein C9J19_08465 [Photobacterium phosphoreum]|uniref:hypothetical protein n=1 Tax=Photobacterium phosphoreum TaxID=659 RepID=UPI000D168978|nr:hypothetical protein [Photobacterium phosphoreum]PSW29055.1 hypothetical protein C9J19_08465 [Photobacterium phosphoreum]